MFWGEGWGLFGALAGGFLGGAALLFGGDGVLFGAPFAGPFEDVWEVAEHFFVGDWAVVWWVGDEVIWGGVVAAELGGVLWGVWAGVAGFEGGGEDVLR